MLIIWLKKQLLFNCLVHINIIVIIWRLHLSLRWLLYYLLLLLLKWYLLCIYCLINWRYLVIVWIWPVWGRTSCACCIRLYILLLYIFLNITCLIIRIKKHMQSFRVILLLLLLLFDIWRKFYFLLCRIRWFWRFFNLFITRRLCQLGGFCRCSATCLQKCCLRRIFICQCYLLIVLNCILRW